MCGSCVAPTKYICLSCANAFCMTCSVCEEDEEKPKSEDRKVKQESRRKVLE